MGNEFNVYRGEGETLEGRDIQRPRFEQPESITDAARYIAEPGLRDAINVAIALGQPLLLTGEPGTGKTVAADSVAYELGLDQPIKAHVKTTSTARDLFYQYDAVRHFHESNFIDDGEKLDPETYVEYDALGLAILLAMEDADRANRVLPMKFHGKGPVRSVVLIDEVDKAPRDLPNDVLNEIEHMAFTVRETKEVYKASDAFRPIVIMTSNSERNLPDAFLRRCVFYNLLFPDEDRLRAILVARLSGTELKSAPVEPAIELFQRVRDLPGLKKKPATAELIGWVRLLTRLGIDPANDSDRDRLPQTASLLGKTREDQARIAAELKG